MQPQPAAPPKKGLTERVALVTLVGLSVFSVLAVALVTVYLDQINESTSALARTEPMPAYVGRPQQIAAPNGSSPMNFLVLATKNGTLHSVVVANLSASRRSLTLITIPADLVVTTGPDQTLSTSFAMDPAITVRAMEGLTAARMDHQLQLDLDCFATTIDAVGGAQLADAQVNGTQAVTNPPQADDAGATSLGTGSLLRAALIGVNSHYSALDPSRFSTVIDAINPCVKVDAGLTAEVIESAVIETSIHPEDTRLWPLATEPGPSGPVADRAALAVLRDGLASPELVATEQYHQAAFLPQEPRR